MTNKPKTAEDMNAEQILKQFEDFYWEQGKYRGRKNGIHGYKDFLLSAMKDAASAMVVEQKRVPQITAHSNSSIIQQSEMQARAIAHNAARQDQLAKYKAFFGEE